MSSSNQNYEIQNLEGNTIVKVKYDSIGLITLSVVLENLSYINKGWFLSELIDIWGFNKVKKSKDNQKIEKKIEEISKLLSRVKKISFLHLQHVGKGAFDNFTNLKVVKFPSTVRILESKLFQDCCKLEKVYLYTQNLQKVDKDVFYEMYRDVYGSDLYGFSFKKFHPNKHERPIIPIIIFADNNRENEKIYMVRDCFPEFYPFYRYCKTNIKGTDIMKTIKQEPGHFSYEEEPEFDFEKIKFINFTKFTKFYHHTFQEIVPSAQKVGQGPSITFEIVDEVKKRKFEITGWACRTDTKLKYFLEQQIKPYESKLYKNYIIDEIYQWNVKPGERFIHERYYNSINMNDFQMKKFLNYVCSGKINIQEPISISINYNYS